MQLQSLSSRLHILTRGLLWSLFLLLACAAAATSLHAQTPDDDDERDEGDDPVIIFNRAQDAHAKGDLARAIELYTEAIKVRPEFPEAEYQKGIAHISLKQTTEAEKSLRRAIKMRAEWPLPQTALGLLLVNAGNDAGAEPFLRRAIELDAKDSNALAALAALRLRAGANEEALKLIVRATAQKSATADMWVGRAAIERAAGDPVSAAASITRALELDPNNAAALEERTAIAAEAGDFERIIPEVEAALQRAAPNSPQLRTRLANLHARAGEKYRVSDPQKSLQHYRRAAELEPSNVNHATGYASALVQARRFEEAAALLRRILTSAPDNYVAHANLATALDGLKLSADALVEYKWLNAARPDLAVTYFLLARAYDLTGDFELALATYEIFLAKADATQNGLEMEKVNLRLPNLRRQIKNGQGAKRKN